MTKTASWSLILCAVGLGLVILLGALWLFGKTDRREPFYGPHQGGITTGPQKFAFVAAFDLTTTKADEVRTLFQTWTRAAAQLSQGQPLADDQGRSQPPADTGETLGYRPARLTFTFGVGPSLFDDRFGLAGQRPKALAPLPSFPGDNLNPQWSDGDLVVQVGADDFQTAYHALHNLTRLAKGVAVPRWVQSGFQPGLETNPSGPGRNLQGFLDGTVNPDPKQPESGQVIWVDQGPAWLQGGSYLVVRRIRMFVETWDRASLGDQERTIGRDKLQGEPLETQAEDSHVRLARGAGVEKILRRPFSYVNGLDGRTGQWDSGLLFLAWMRDPGRQFVPMQTRLSQFDALNEYIQPVGSGLFAVFPGVAEGDFVGSSLFPLPPLTDRIQALQAVMGATYGPLSRGDWQAVRQGASTWESLWAQERPTAGNWAKTIDALGATWKATLAEPTPLDARVRQAQGALVRSLSDWERAVASPPAPVNLGPGLKAPLVRAHQALAKGDLPEARTAFTAFQQEWTRSEAWIRQTAPSAYGQIEVLTGTVRRALQDQRAGAEAVAPLGRLLEQVEGLQPRAAYSAWDAGFLLFREGLEALLVLAALLAFLDRTNQSRRKPWVWTGAALGIGTSLCLAFLVSLVLNGWMAAAPELVEGWTGLVAVGLMLVVGGWLHKKAVIQDWNQWLKGSMNRAQGPWAFGVLAFVAVLREGGETVVFFWGMAGSLPWVDLLVGITGGLAVLAVLGVVMIGFSKRIPLGLFFPVATALIFFLTVKILGQSLGALQTSGVLPRTPWPLGTSIDWLGYSPSWETGLPQILLALVLASLLGASLLSRRRKKEQKPVALG